MSHIEPKCDAARDPRGTYVRTERDERLERAFDLMLSRTEQPHLEGRCLVLVGESGAGKTRALDRLFRKRLPDFDSPQCSLVSMTMPSPATVRVWGRTVLNALGYPLRSNLKEAVVWEMVRDNLSQSSVRCLHFDEFQHVSQTANTLQRIAILNTIKHLLIGEVAAPVGVVLSGLPEIVKLIESDPQMKRRALFVRFGTMDGVLHADVIKATISRLAQEAGCLVDEGPSFELARRVCHAASGQLGQAVDLIRDAVALAQARHETTLTMLHFGEVFAVASGSSDAFNPFVAANFAAIDCGRVLLESEGLPMLAHRAGRAAYPETHT